MGSSAVTHLPRPALAPTPRLMNSWGCCPPCSTVEHIAHQPADLQLACVYECALSIVCRDLMNSQGCCPRYSTAVAAHASHQSCSHVLAPAALLVKEVRRQTAAVYPQWR